MEKKILIGAWFVGTLLSTLLVLSLRKKRILNWALQLTDVMHIMIGGFSSLSGVFLVYKVVMEFDKLESIVGLEGIVSMFLGSLAMVWFGTIEIATLIPQKAKNP
jgi:hypothetical protein